MSVRQVRQAMDGTARLAWLVASLGALVSGCARSVDQPLEETIEQTYQVDPTASISIRNLDGSIQIYGSASPELKVQVIKKAYTAERLNGISVDVSAQPDAVSIEANFPPRKTWAWSDRSGTVDCIIVAPQASRISRLDLANGEVLVAGIRGGEVHANLGNGRMLGRNCFGDLHCTVKTGTLTLIYDWWDGRKFFVDAAIEDGNAWAVLPGDASFRLVAETVNGKIANDFAAQEQRRGTATNKIDIVAGEAAQADIKIQATDGNIKITEANP